MVARSFYVYILSGRIGGTLYIGVTNDIVRGVTEHRLKQAKSFTKKHEVDRLVYFEQFDDAENAIKREKRLKKWNRAWNIRLIEEFNPNWDDLCSSIAGVYLSLSYFSSSYPAKAGYPVIRGVHFQTRVSRNTGSSAFADDDA